MKTKFDIFAEIKEEANGFKGFKALFWAGKMSSYTKEIMNSSPKGMGDYLWLLEKCADEYDDIIFKTKSEASDLIM